MNIKLTICINNIIDQNFNEDFIKISLKNKAIIKEIEKENINADLESIRKFAKKIYLKRLEHDQYIMSLS
jgi:hypothetical protein